MLSEKDRAVTSEQAPLWRREPFRVLFPLGIGLAWAGIGHWLLYWGGLVDTYSCEGHGLIQMQGFMVAFAAGFLLTALPRRTAAPPASSWTLLLIGLGLIVVTTAGSLRLWVLMQGGYLLVWASLAGFGIPRLLGAGAGRRPPAGFILMPIAALHGVGGAVLLLVHHAGREAPVLDGAGRLLIEQGVFLCLSLGVGSLFYPLMSGMPPPADLDASSGERRRMAWFAAAGVGILATLVVEAAGWERAGPLLRALVLALGFVRGIGANRLPLRPGLNRLLVWAGLWMQPIGLAAAGLWPDYRVPALHMTFIGGFSLLALSVGAHVALSHGGLERLRDQTPWPVMVWSLGIVLALLARLAADWSETYFAHLASAAVMWIGGSLVWLLFLTPALVRTGASEVPAASGDRP